MRTRTVTVKEMRELDRRATEEYGIPALLLMENAGRGTAELVRRIYKPGRVLILCGKGNNGGDGWVIARHLYNHGWPAIALPVSNPDAFEGDARLNYNIAKNMHLTHDWTEDRIEDKIAEGIASAELIIDSLLGVGLTSAPRGIYAESIKMLNRTGKPVIAVDVPSGLNADTGEAPGEAVKAARTATMGRVKQGLLERDGPAAAGIVEVIDIGLPRQLLESK